MTITCLSMLLAMMIMGLLLILETKARRLQPLHCDQRLCTALSTVYVVHFVHSSLYNICKMHFSVHCDHIGALCTVTNIGALCTVTNTVTNTEVQRVL